MDSTKLRIVCLTTFIACIPVTGFTGQSYEQLLNDEASEVSVDPASTDSKQQKRKSPAIKPQQLTLNQEKFESGLEKEFPFSFSVYSALTRKEQQQIYKIFKSNANYDFIQNLIISIATK